MACKWLTMGIQGNVQTVKDVNFFGLNDEYVVSGSDCGHLFIWDRETTELVQLLYGDDETVNVAVGHPHQPTLAVSGIDYTVKLFSPDKQLQSEFADAETSAVPSESTNSVTVSRRSFQDRREIINRNDTLHELGGAGTVSFSGIGLSFANFPWEDYSGAYIMSQGV